MNWKIVSPYERIEPNCFGDKPRIYADKIEAVLRARELNEAAYKDEAKKHLAGTFAFIETNEAVP